MRALFLVALFALGCGSASPPAASDLATVVPDLTTAKYSCGQLAQCAASCGGNLDCQAQCAVNASPSGLQRFGAFAACVVLACGPAGDGGPGGNESCPLPPDKSSRCQSCIANVGIQATLDAHASCHDEYVACLATE